MYLVVGCIINNSRGSLKRHDDKDEDICIFYYVVRIPILGVFVLVFIVDLIKYSVRLHGLVSARTCTP